MSHWRTDWPAYVTVSTANQSAGCRCDNWYWHYQECRVWRWQDNVLTTISISKSDHPFRLCYIAWSVLRTVLRHSTGAVVWWDSQMPPLILSFADHWTPPDAMETDTPHMYVSVTAEPEGWVAQWRHSQTFAPCWSQYFWVSVSSSPNPLPEIKSTMDTPVLLHPAGISIPLSQCFFQPPPPAWG